MSRGKLPQRIHQTLFCPGPVCTTSSVKKAILDYEIGHRELEFCELLKRLNQNILKLYQVDKLKTYQSVIITGSGTAANEAMLSSTVPGKKVLVLCNGEFGERLYDISKFHNPKTRKLDFGWANPIRIDQVEKKLKSLKPDILVMVHHETSTGMLNPIEDIGKLAKKYKADFFIDTVSSSGTELINLKKCNVTFCSSSASKAICSLPGLSMVIGKKKAFLALKNKRAKTIYLDLYKFYEFSTTVSQTPNTPAVQLFFALDRAIDNILKVGIEKKLKQVHRTARLIRNGLKDLGMTFLIDESQMSSVLTTVNVPDPLTPDIIQEELRRKNIIVYKGKGPIKKSAFQVSHIGKLSAKDINYFLYSMKQLLVKYKCISSNGIVKQTSSITAKNRTPRLKYTPSYSIA